MFPVPAFLPVMVGTVDFSVTGSPAYEVAGLYNDLLVG